MKKAIIIFAILIKGNIFGLGKTSEILPKTFAELNKDIIQLGVFIATGLDLADNAVKTRLDTYNKMTSSDPCENVVGGYQLGKDITFVGINFVPIGAGKSVTFRKVQILIAKFYKIGPARIVRWRQAGTYFKVLLKDIHSQSDEFLNYLLSLPGNPKAYEVLQNSALLRVDVDLLRKLDKYLEFKSPEEVAKVRQLIEAAPDDKTRRKVLEAIQSNGGRVFRIITTDFRQAIRDRIDHIRKIIFEPKGTGWRFSGCHSKSALDELGANARIELIRPVPKITNEIYEAKVYAKGPDGMEILKSGFGGKSTFFPDNWGEARIIEEVEHAVMNNRGFFNGSDSRDGYFGYSMDFKIKIRFYFRETDGYIGSFFPSID